MSGPSAPGTPHLHPGSPREPFSTEGAPGPPPCVTGRRERHTEAEKGSWPPCRGGWGGRGGWGRAGTGTTVGGQASSPRGPDHPAPPRPPCSPERVTGPDRHWSECHGHPHPLTAPEAAARETRAEPHSRRSRAGDPPAHNTGRRGVVRGEEGARPAPSRDHPSVRLAVHPGERLAFAPPQPHADPPPPAPAQPPPAGSLEEQAGARAGGALAGGPGL